jgi:ketosteroid isomerase-like protein
MSRENLEIIRHAFEAFNEGDFSAFLDLYDEDIVLRIAPPSIESGSFYGAKAVEDQYRRFFAPFGESYRVEIEELIEAGDSVLVLHRARARGRRSGAEVESVNQWGIFTMRGGRIIRIDQAADRKKAFEAVGLQE